jgi:hypothetical protein
MWRSDKVGEKEKTQALRERRLSGLRSNWAMQGFEKP